MKLTKEQQQILIDKLNELWIDKKKCEICDNTDWMIDDKLFEFREFQGGKTVFGGGAIKPVITVTCTKCGNTKILNAIQLGVVDPKNPTGDKEGGQKHG